MSHGDIHEEDIEFESDSQFPDPQAAKTLLRNGLASISNVEVASGALVALQQRHLVGR